MERPQTQRPTVLVPPSTADSGDNACANDGRVSPLECYNLTAPSRRGISDDRSIHRYFAFLPWPMELKVSDPLFTLKPEHTPRHNLFLIYYYIGTLDNDGAYVLLQSEEAIQPLCKLQMRVRRGPNDQRMKNSRNKESTEHFNPI